VSTTNTEQPIDNDAELATIDTVVRLSEGEAARKRHVEIVIPLLKEYAGKLNALAANVFDLIGRKYTRSTAQQQFMDTEAAWIVASHRGVVQQLEKLARVASQMLEHYKLDRIVELEVKLRLNELEQALDSSDEAVQSLYSLWPKLKAEKTAGSR
jgi:hypothetical protein